MDTAVKTPLEVFALPQHLVVPLFQRPYVWDEENQWGPLWQDIRRLTDHKLINPTAQATHFLGAIVLQAMEAQFGSMPAWSIIDGQQRLTTLQIVFDAAAAEFETRELDQLAGQLTGLTHNSPHFIQGDGIALKLRHSNRDRDAYDQVMDADPPIDYDSLESTSSLIVRAHQYFAEQIASWLDEAGHTVTDRGGALAGVLTQAIQLVVIGLRADENSQEIFETLNARGTPLTAADLIKNFVFQRLEAEGEDTKRAYAEVWPFDSKFWEKEISVGRYLVSRGSLFLNQWLVSRVGEEIGPKSTFTRFKYFVEHETLLSMSELLTAIKAQADRYQSWTERAGDPHADLDVVTMCVYRSQAAAIETLKPIMIWLHEPGATFTPVTIDRIVATVESWIMRRVLLRLALGDLGRVVADLVKTHRGVPDNELADRVEAFLSRQNAPSTYWPGDEELRRSLEVEQAYRRFKRGRLRMFLEAAEDHYRGFTGDKPSKTGMRVDRRGFHIEHLLPQKWSTHWKVLDLAAEVDRDAHVHRLGNLTLLTGPLNSSVSNGQWLGVEGKRDKLKKHDVFLMNRTIRDESAEGWTESLIDSRTDELIDAFIATWPVPEGHQGTTTATVSRVVSEVSMKELVAAGAIVPGTRLRARSGSWGIKECEVLPTGELSLDGHNFSSPSGAGHHLRGGATNGWWFWSMPDGRRLKDVRDDFRRPEADKGPVPS